MSFDWRTGTAVHDDVTAWLGLGTNLGNRRANLMAALHAIRETGKIDAVSSVYESEPVGLQDQPDFWNLVLRLRTSLQPADLLTALKRIEAELGREPGVRWGPRLIDVDILLYDGEIIHEPGLRIPHPRMLERGFVMLPLYEIDPHAVHPETGTRILDLIATRTFERNRRLFPGAELVDVPAPIDGDA